MANVQSINSGRRKRSTRVEPVVEQIPAIRPAERSLVLEDLLAPGLRLRVWSVAHSLTPSRF